MKSKYIDVDAELYKFIGNVIQFSHSIYNEITQEEWERVSPTGVPKEAIIAFMNLIMETDHFVEPYLLVTEQGRNTNPKKANKKLAPFVEELKILRANQEQIFDLVRGELKKEEKNYSSKELSFFFSMVIDFCREFLEEYSKEYCEWRRRKEYCDWRKSLDKRGDLPDGGANGKQG